MVTASGLGMVVMVEAKGELKCVGQMINYAEDATVLIRQPDGSQVLWSASLVREATPIEAAIVQTLAPAQNECTHAKSFGRLSYVQNAILCGRCRKAVEE